jgi:hypothetical protein
VHDARWRIAPMEDGGGESEKSVIPFQFCKRIAQT